MKKSTDKELDARIDYLNAEIARTKKVISRFERELGLDFRTAFEKKEEEEAVKAMRRAINGLVRENFSRKIDAKRRRAFARDFDEMLAQVATPIKSR